MQEVSTEKQIRRSLPLDQKKRYYNASTKAKVYASTVWRSCCVENIYFMDSYEELYHFII